MLNQLLTIGLTNAALATLLALLVGLALRWRRNSQLAALLWGLVLLRLVTPPLLSISIERPALEVASTPDSVDLSRPVPVSADDLDGEFDFASHHRPSTTDQPTAAPTRSRPLTAPLPAVVPTPANSHTTLSDSDRFTAHSLARSFRFVKQSLSRPLVWAGIWLGGAALAAAWLIFNGLRFHRLIHDDQIATTDLALNKTLAHLCRQYNIRRTPRLRVLDARVSPMLWTWFNGTTLIVPRSLIGSLSGVQRELLLTHELAHLIRRDHLFRWLEFATQAIYWWLPLVRPVRQRMHAMQEECCDAFVNQHYPGQQLEYCDALLTAARWLQEARPSPVWASGLGSPTGLKHRIQLMLNQQVSKPLSRRAVAGCVLMGMAVCVISVAEVEARKTNAAIAERDLAPMDTELVEPKPERQASTEAFVLSAEMKTLIEKVRENEALYRNLDATWKITLDYNPTEFWNWHSRELNYHLVSQKDRFAFTEIQNIETNNRKTISRNKSVVFDGTATVAIAEDNSATLFRGRYEPDSISPPHCWPLFSYRIDYPLSVYLGGRPAVNEYFAEWARQHTKTQNYRGSAVECKIVGEEKVGNVNCIKVRAIRSYPGGKLRVAEYFWLAKDRNYHIAQVRRAPLVKDEPETAMGFAVTQWKELAGGVWLPMAVEPIGTPPADQEPEQFRSQELRVEQAVLNPTLPDTLFELPEIPKTLPYFVVGHDGRLEDSPHHPKPATADANTTLDTILKQLAVQEENEKLGNFEMKTSGRSEQLRPIHGTHNRDVVSSKSQRQFIKAENRAYISSQSIGQRADGGIKTSKNIEAYDGTVRRSYTEQQTGTDPPTFESYGGIAFDSPEYMFKRLQQTRRYYPRTKESNSLSDYIKGGWFDRHHMHRMTVEYVGDETIDGLHCHKLECNSDPGFGDLRHIWLARDRNLLPIRVEFYDRRRSVKLPRDIYFVESLKKARPDLWLTDRKTTLSCRTGPLDRPRANQLEFSSRGESQIESLTLDPEVDEKLFSYLEAPAGTEISVTDEQGENFTQVRQKETGNINVTPEQLKELKQFQIDLKKRKEAESKLQAANDQQTATAEVSPAKGADTTREIVFQVTDEQGNPVPAGRVSLAGTTDDGQNFPIELAIKNGRAPMKFNPPKFRELRLTIIAPQFQTYRLKYDIDASQPYEIASQYRYQLKPVVTIGGTILDEAGQPLQGVKVDYYSMSKTRPDGGTDTVDGDTKTDANGRWTASSVAPEPSRLRLQFRHISHYYETTEPYRSVAVSSDEFAGLRAQTDVRTMQAAKPLVGRVVDPAGNPVSDVVVEMSGWTNHLKQIMGPGYEIKTDTQGRFRIPMSPDGEQSLSFDHPRWPLMRVPVNLPADEPLQFTLQHPRNIEFVTLDQSGKPIEGVTFRPNLRESNFHGRTDATGHWVWENAPDETLHYQISHRDFLSQLPDSAFKPEDSPVTLTLRPVIPVIATVADAETGEPVDGYRLIEGSHFKVNDPSFWNWSSATTDKWGKAGFKTHLRTLDRLFRYRVQARGYLPQVSRPLDAALLPDEPVRLEFRLQKATALQWTVLTPAGVPAAGAQVAIKDKGAGLDNFLRVTNGLVDEMEPFTPSFIATCDGKGQMSLPVRDQPFVCFISHESGFLELADTDLNGQQEVMLTPWAGLEETIITNGKPAANIEISSYDLQSQLSHLLPSQFPSVFYTRAATSNSTGRFRLLRLPSRTSYLLTSQFPSVFNTQETTSDSTGQFQLTRGTPGLWRFVVAPADDVDPAAIRRSPLWSNQIEVELIAGETTQFEMGRSGADVVGRVMIPDTSDIDLEFSGVHFIRKVPNEDDRRRRRECYQARLASDGTFRCYGLPPGEYQGLAVVGRTGGAIRSYSVAIRKPGFEKTLELSAEMFEGKSSTEPIDLGQIDVDEEGR